MHKIVSSENMVEQEFTLRRGKLLRVTYLGKGWQRVRIILRGIDYATASIRVIGPVVTRITGHHQWSPTNTIWATNERDSEYTINLPRSRSLLMAIGARSPELIQCTGIVIQKPQGTLLLGVS